MFLSLQRASLYRLNNFLLFQNYSKKFFITTQVSIPSFVINYDNIADNKGARKKKLRVGRGPGSGIGKTCGRGTKGMKARTGGRVAPNMEGGSTNIMKRLPKYGMTNSPVPRRFEYVNLSKIVYYVNKGMIDPSKTITIRDLFEVGAFAKVKNGIKLLGGGKGCLQRFPPLNLEVSSATKSAIDAVKLNGGSVTCVHRTPLTLRYHIKPYKFPKPLLDPLPTFKKVQKLIKLSDNGANVVFREPRWMEGNMNYLKDRREKFTKMLNQQKNAEVLQEYPVKIYPGCGQNKIRIRRKPTVRKFNFESKV